MTAFTIAFASLALLLGIYAFVGLPFGSKWRRAAVSGFFAILLAGLFFGYSDMLGRPKSTRLEVLRPSESEAKVLGSYMVEGTGIYLWLQLKGNKEPRYYVLPWEEKMARDLQKAIAENAERHGSGVAGSGLDRFWPHHCAAARGRRYNSCLLVAVAIFEARRGNQTNR